jgi:uncharacterized membrane protein YhaH (DUF805 family)
MKLFPRLDQNFWRRSTNFWTIIFFIAIVADFVTENGLDENGLILIIAVFYTAFLAVYSAEKEFKRWHNYNQTMHPGELYVILWTILIICLVSAHLYFHGSYELPAEVRATYIVVIGILAITKESKKLYKDTSKRKGKR